MRQSEGSGRSRTGRIRRDKSAADSPAESLGGKRIIGLGRGHGPLHDTDMVAIHEAALAVLAKTGLGDASPIVVDLVVAAGGTFDARGRLLFPPDLVMAALAGLRRDITLYGRAGVNDMVLSSGAVHVGTGGASPLIFDGVMGRYRESNLLDLYDAARLVDRLEHIHFLSRPVVARDMPDVRHLDVNTAFACLSGTVKHVFTSASSPDSVEDIATICYQIAGSQTAFRDKPFLSLNVNHVVPPLRFDPIALDVMVEAVRCGIPVMVNCFGQLGASSPVTIAGCVTQTIAETLAGMVIAWLVDPDALAVFGPRPMITDLRTGGMAGGSGEQALLTAAAIQMARFYQLSSSTIAGATDSKSPDAQSGFEKCLNVSQTVQAGANIITQACGAQAGLMGLSLAALVIDNDMLGSILRASGTVAVSPETIALESIDRVALGVGHFLGEPETYARMHSDFLYPKTADRLGIEAWEEAGSPDIRDRAHERVKTILDDHHPTYIDAESEMILRKTLPILLPPRDQA
ncbi:trimethylamine methyltransferase family protein [Alphaproteobacteria bacterium]|jgi:trimethylamine--corrinoid protein Co-methyltransferase|nr:trimethylamine methyltransferase family protein [Alphaproteobacteria bacterium]